MNALFAADVHSFSTDGTLPTTTMHPDITNRSFDTVSHHAIGLLWGRHQQRTLDGRLNFLQAQERDASVAINWDSFWIIQRAPRQLIGASPAHGCRGTFLRNFGSGFRPG